MSAVKVPDPVQPGVRPVLQLHRIRVPGPDEMPPDMSSAVEIDQAVRLLPRGLVHLVKIAGDHQPARPAVLTRRELPGLLIDPGMAGQDGTGAGRVHDEANGVRADEHPEPPACRAVPVTGANTRHVVSSACRCQESLFRSAIASASGTSSAPACAHVPASVAGEISAPCRDKARHQRVHAPARGEPLRQQHRDEPVGEQALPDRLARPRRHHRPLHPARAGTLIPTDDSSPFPQLRELRISAASTRATFGVTTGPAGAAAGTRARPSRYCWTRP